MIVGRESNGYLAEVPVTYIELTRFVLSTSVVEEGGRGATWSTTSMQCLGKTPFA